MNLGALDLNCDLGEGEAAARTVSLMRQITSANVACGGHAGDLATMTRCVQLAKRHGVRLGAHPGPWNRGDFGRGAVRLTPPELELLLLQQVGALEQIARASRLPLHHIKLHGALYHASESDRRLARRYLETVGRYWPECIVYAPAGGTVAGLAFRLGVPVWAEVFADRGYCDDGSLVERGQPGALLTTRRAVQARLRLLGESDELATISGGRIRVSAQTICVHADTPQAPRIAATVAASLQRSERGL